VRRLFCRLEDVGVDHSESTFLEVSDFWCADGSRSDSSVPVETALLVDTVVSAKRVVEAGSPILKERTVSVVSEQGKMVHFFAAVLDDRRASVSKK